MSAFLTSAANTSWPRASRKLKYTLWPRTIGGCVRVSSPPGGSILITSAPRSDRIIPPRSPAWYRASSSTRTPSSGLAVVVMASPLHRARGQPLHHVLVQVDIHHDDRQRGERGRRHQLAPEREVRHHEL